MKVFEENKSIIVLNIIIFNFDCLNSSVSSSEAFQ